MADDQLSKLAGALRTASQPVTLSAAFMTAAGATPPDGLDRALAAAYRLPPLPAGVTVAFDAGNVGPVSGGAFEVSRAQLSFIGWEAARSDVTLRFSLRDVPGGGQVVDVLIAVALDGWRWTDAFPHMTGWPFEVAEAKRPSFAFTTAPATWDGLALQPGQSFDGRTLLPEEIAALLGVIGLTPPAGEVQLGGPVVLDRVRDEEPTILYPELDLSAPLARRAARLFWLPLRDPAAGLLVETVEELEPDEEGRRELAYEQTPSLWLGAVLDIGGGVAVDVRARALADASLFTFTFAVDPAGPRLTPAKAIELAAGSSGASFLAGVPAPLLSFLDLVALEGVAFTGGIDPLQLLSVSARLGSDPGRPLVLFDDPVGGQRFAIDRFWVEWSVMQPLDPASSTSAVLLGAELTLWPRVFRDGPFVVEIDQDLRIAGGYPGTVQLSDVLSGLTAGAVELPAGVSAGVTGFEVVVDPRARRYEVGGVLDVLVDFVTVAGKPLLQVEELELSLAAFAPAAGRGSGMAFQASMAGWIAIGPLATEVALSYDGAEQPPLWTLHAALAEELRLSELVGQFFRDYDLPTALLPGSLTVEAFSIDAELASRTPSRYAVDGTVRWDTLPFGLALAAQLQLAYDGARRAGEQFSGAVIGTVALAQPALRVEVGYQFGTDADGRDSRILWVSWAGVRGAYNFGRETVTVSLAGWTVGGLISAMVRTLGDPYFELASPWDLLNRIPLDGLRLVIDTRRDARQRLSATYTLSSPIELGFLTIRGLVFTRGEDGRVLLAIDGSCTIPGLRDQPLFRPASGGQDVRRLPDVPGQGTQYFKLHLLALGQRVAITGSDRFTSTEQAVRALEHVPATTGGSNPVDPSSRRAGQPYYSRDAGWLVAAHLGVLQVGRVWTFDLKLVFADPGLYGLRLAFNGEKAKVLDGLALDVSYRKVSDDVGVYQLEFSFPKSLRTFDLGAFTITLPTIGLRIYTNGDFLFDFGFPYNLDFTRSFTLQAIVYGVPVIGSAGFYFGKLPPGDVPGMPHPGTGSFSSAIVFGLGVQLGVGRYFEKGPLKAGFSITVFGIVEGAIAAWNPGGTGALEAGGSLGGALAERGELLPQAVGGSAVQGDYWFRLSGTFGIIGKLYGSVDFAIIKADVSLTVTLSARIVYEAFKNIELSASASVDVRVSIKIDLGLFSIRISFSFSTTITADLTIETSGTPPWGAAGLGAGPRESRRRALGAGPAALAAPLPQPSFKRVVRSGTQPRLRLTPAPQYTVLGPESGPASAQEGAFVLLLAIDAPVADGSGNRAGSSFESLSAALLPWVLDAFYGAPGTTVDLDAFAQQTTVTRAQLAAVVQALAGDSPIAEPEVEQKLLAAGFTVDLAPADVVAREGLSAGASLFPAFSGLSLTVPDPDGRGGTVTVPLGGAATIDGTYREALAQAFRRLAAQVEDESGSGLRAQAGEPAASAEAVSRFVFEDWFTLVAQQLLQAAEDVLGDYAHALAPADSIASLVEWAHQRGNEVTALDVATPNLLHPLAARLPLTIPGLRATVQAGDSVAALAARFSDPSSSPRWKTAPAALIVANADVHGLLAGGVAVAVGGASATTQAGDSFADLAAALRTTVELLAADAGVQARGDLLVPGVVVAVPDLAYATADDGSDTLDLLVRRFGVPLATLAGDARNQAVAGLFGSGTIAIANLERLRVEDLWQAIRRSDRVAQVAGMVARFSLHGMRLPTGPGLTLGPRFPWKPGPSEYGLYQLTGQQLPVPPLDEAPSWALSIAKGDDLGWLELSGSTATRSISLDCSEQARQLHWLLQWAQANGYDPAPTLRAEPAAAVGAKRYALPAATPWSSSDAAAIAALTRPPAARALGAAAGEATAAAAQPQPLLWSLPESLAQQVVARQATLARRFGRASQLLPYLPVVAPQTGTSDPASGHTTYADVDDRVLVARIPFEVKLLAQADGRAPQRPDATDAVPPGPGNDGAPPPLAPFTYELIGPSAADAPLLQRLLTAMDSLGERLVQRLFLLCPDGAGERAGLASRGDDELLAFLLQTNLSTETNPPPLRGAEALRAGDGRPVRGIANRPAEFVKLLWECSTVRSGGYYLHYELPEEGAGLPASIFDTSGSATLTLVIAYDRELLDAAGGGRLTDFVNAFATTAPIDVERTVMTALSQSAPVAAPALAGHETLAQLTALYGTDAGRLAALNGTVPLAAGSRIPLEGVVHQVDGDDLAGGDPLGAVAARFSRGASEPLTGAALAAFNPGVAPVLGAPLRIPPLTSVIGSGGANGPGASFDALAGWYGLSHDALGAAARDVPGLLGTAAPRVDSEQRDLLAGLGTGNAGVELTRANLGEPPALPQRPTGVEVEAFARGYLFSLYTLLQATVPETPFFRASTPGMPFGPRHLVDPDEAHARRNAPERRRAALRAAADAPLDYSQTVGFRTLAKVDPVPGDADRANPYAGVGTLLTLRLRWLDLFGNVAPTPFTAPPAGYRGPLNGLPLALGYGDRIVGLAQWPNVRSFHRYDGAAGQPRLTVALSLQTAAYEGSGGAAAAAQDLRTFELVGWQLAQDYDGADVPGLSGRAVSMALESTLLADPRIALGDDRERAVRGFVAACTAWLRAVVAGGDPGPAPAAALTFDVALDRLADDDVIALRLAFVLERRASLVDPALRALDDGRRDATAVLPAGGDDRSAVSLRGYAEAFEQAFATADWQLRVGTSAAAADAVSVWAVRMARRAGGPGLGYAIDAAPSFYAPRPLATELRSARVEIGTYASGRAFPAASTSAQFSGVDLNVWAQQAFRAIDAFLAPAYAGSALVLDRLLRALDPAHDDLLEQVLEHKATLAGAVAASVEPILAASADDAATRDAAGEKLRQALLNELSAAFSVTAVTVFGVSGARDRRPLPPGVASAPRFFGQPLGTLSAPARATGAADAGDSSGQQTFALSSAKVPLTPAGGDGDSRLAFLFSSKDAAEQAYVTLDLSWAMTQLEHEIRTVPGIRGYEQSSWIAFATGPFTTPVATAVEIPVVLRALPQPPTVTTQTADASVARPVRPQQLAEWDYAFGYLYPGAAQDTVTATVRFNVPPQLVRGQGDAEAELFRSLAQFASAYPAVAADLDAALRQLDGRTEPGDPRVQTARFAVAAFAQLAGEVATAYEAWARPPTGVAVASGESDGPVPVTRTFELGLSAAAQQRARVDVYSADGPDAPPPDVRIDPETWEARAAGSLAPGARWGFEYLRRGSDGSEPGDWLGYGEALALPARSVGYDGLDVLGVQNGWSSVHVVRNERLVPDGVTRDTFRFQTPEVQFADPVVPLLRHDGFPLDTVMPGPAPLADWLSSFFAQLLEGASAGQVALKLSAAYAWRVAPGDDTPETALPIALLPVTPYSGEAVAAFAARVSDWLFETVRPVLGPSSRLSFAVELFAAHAAVQTLPLLTIADLSLPVSALRPA